MRILIDDMRYLDSQNARGKRVSEPRDADLR
jgi:hypothetical protein